MGIFRRFWSGREGRNGNAAILFALALVPLVGATGAAVDYSMANSNRTSMQKALDATALALAKLMPLSQAQLDTQGWQIFQASLGNVSVTLKQSDLKIQTPATGKLILDVSGQYQPSISGVIGIQNFPVGAHAEVTWGIKKLEVALALDNTGSMASNNKMTELKKAAKNLIDTLQKAARIRATLRCRSSRSTSRPRSGRRTSMRPGCGGISEVGERLLQQIRQLQYAEFLHEPESLHQVSIQQSQRLPGS